MEGTQLGSRHRMASDQGPLEPKSYGNGGFAEEHDSENRTKKKQSKSSKRKYEAEFRLRNAPKPAWNDGGDPEGSKDQLEGNGVEEDSGFEGRGRAVECETSFANLPYVPQETDDLETMVIGLERNIELAFDSLSQCAKTRDRARKLASSTHLEVERRKASMVEAIEEYSRRLNENVDGRLSLFEAETEEVTQRLKEMLKSMKKTYETRSQLSHVDSKALRDQLLKWVSAWNESKAPENLSLPVDLSTTETQMDYISILQVLFGVSKNHDTGNNFDDESSAVDGKAPSRSVEQRKHATALKFKYSLESRGLCGNVWNPLWRPRVEGKNPSDASKRQLPPATLRIENKIRVCPQPVLTFSCRLKKDKRTCGITDLALTDEGQVLVLDKNNKVVKMFDSQGTFLKYFGKNDLRRPSRISRVRSRDQIAVTDEGSSRVLVFSKDGQFQSQLITLQRPVGHCLLTASRLAILEFSTRSVVICDLGGKIVSTFPTHLECPSYIACTKSENIIVTDWKSESFKIFDATGCERFSYCHSSSVESARHVVEPYGVCADDDGVFIVADRKKREVVFFSEEGGTEIWSYDDAVNQIGVPFAVDCNASGVLAIGEYSGTIRLFKYKTNEDDDEGPADTTTGEEHIYAEAIPPRAF